MSASLFEMAADVRELKRDINELCREIRHKDGQWTDYTIAVEDSINGAESALRNCLNMLGRIHVMAEKEKARLQPNAKVQGKAREAGFSPATPC